MLPKSWPLSARGALASYAITWATWTEAALKRQCNAWASSSIALSQSHAGKRACAWSTGIFHTSASAFRQRSSRLSQTLMHRPQRGRADGNRDSLPRWLRPGGGCSDVRRCRAEVQRCRMELPAHPRRRIPMWHLRARITWCSDDPWRACAGGLCRSGASPIARRASKGNRLDDRAAIPPGPQFIGSA